MNFNEALRKRRLGITNKVDIDFAIDRIRLKEVIKLESMTDGMDVDDEINPDSGPMACTKLDNGLMAVATGVGCVNLLRTNPLKSVGHHTVHENSILEVKASIDSKSLFTGSGDATIKQWDIESKKVINILKSHCSTIRSISIYDANVLASGGRDGCIKVHDLRVKEPTVIDIRDAHRNRVIGKPRRLSVKTDPISCVTSVVFDPHFPRIYSAGANDATIKLWDLRKTSQTNRPTRSRTGQLLVNQPNIEVHHPSTGVHCGYSHLLLSSGRLYAACSDNKIYCYNNFGSSDAPIRFTGYRYGTYLRLAVLDDRFLLSGGRGGANVWTLGNKRSAMYIPETTKVPIGQLKPDNKECYDTNLIETDWESLSIFTFRDDGLVCKWTMQHVLESERKKLVEHEALASLEEDVTIQMSDIIDVNVLRPNHRVSNVQSPPIN